MKAMLIAGKPCLNFGNNNYSHGMDALVFEPSFVTLDEVRHLPDVFLHPLVQPNSLEIFALLGTDEQFQKFYQDCASAYATAQTKKELGWPDHNDREAWQKFGARQEALEDQFIPWYDLQNECELNAHEAQHC